MLQINENLKNKLLEINEEIRQKYHTLDLKPQNVMEKLKNNKNLIFRHMSKMQEKEIEEITNRKGVIGVDGSINTVGSSFPHYISVMQALAKNTDKKFQDIYFSDIHTPLISEDKHLFVDEKLSPQDTDEKAKTAKMAKLELDAAIRAIETMDTSIIMMDGSLIRYKIYCGDNWDKFVDMALKKKVYVIGVIEEIKTHDLGEVLDIYSKQIPNIYDREILFGALNVGDMIIIKEIKEGRGLKKCFMRTSNDPHVIGMDILEEQQGKINELADLVYTLTPQNGRGIPLWLDIVDSEVKITNKLMDSLIDSYIDKDIRLKLFTAKRDNRSL